MSGTSKNRSLFQKIICLFCLILIVLGYASAHPGRTDANGGHYDRKTGEYHYHHGYPTHQHTDGVCPYDFDDRTGWNSGTSGNGSSKDTSSSSSPAKVPSKPQQKDFPLWGWILIGAFALYLLGSLIKTIVTAKTKKQQEQELLQRYRTLYGGTSAEALSGMPDDTEIGPDNLPKVKGADGWGEKYTVYCTPNGLAYHRKTCRFGASIKVHAYQVGNKYPCQMCKPEIPDQKWFDEYLKIKSLKDKYHI